MYPFALLIPQAQTESVLNECMESLGVRAERQVELVSISETPEPRLELRHADGRVEEVAPRWVMGCDRAHSTVRAKLGIPFEGGGVGLSFYLGDCELDGPDVPEDELAIHTRHGDVVFLGRLSGRVVRVIAALHQEQNTDEENELTVAGLQQAVDRVGVQVKIRSAEWLTPFHVNDRQAKRYRVGNVFLAGDASHIHSPVGGQGMNTGIQDVANLAWKLAAVARGADDNLLNSYEEERSEVGRALLRFTGRGLRLATVANPILERLRDALAQVVSKLPPVQHGAMRFISETAIEYRTSSIVADYGGDGDLRAGDRLPDLRLRHPGTRSTLLEDWSAPRHRVFGLNLDEEDIALLRTQLPHADVVRLATGELEDDGVRLFGDDEKLFVLRPDGYLGFRAPVGFNVELMNYARQDALAAQA
jgi:2-polyprenyl-6-methoxyphenol hydroxylase-like FAD-dependent oxidoreductase